MALIRRCTGAPIPARRGLPSRRPLMAKGTAASCGSRSCRWTTSRIRSTTFSVVPGMVVSKRGWVIRPNSTSPVNGRVGVAPSVEQTRRAASSVSIREKPASAVPAGRSKVSHCESPPWKKISSTLKPGYGRPAPAAGIHAGSVPGSAPHVVLCARAHLGATRLPTPSAAPADSSARRFIPAFDMRSSSEAGAGPLQPVCATRSSLRERGRVACGATETRPVREICCLPHHSPVGRFTSELSTFHRCKCPATSRPVCA